jgi:cytochrome c7-like protein/class III cytochrome C family protein
MPQIFHRSTNTLSRLSIFGALFFMAAFLWGLDLINRSAYVTQVAVARAQPVQFSHKHHAGQLGIDCRYCHSAVEDAAYASIPPTATCMNCHSQIWADSAFLEPVRTSFRTDRSIEWIKIHDLPDFVYFNHAIHVYKGIGCATCHGRVDEMNQIRQASSLQMEWCLDCHRHPERYVRPREHVFDMAWQPTTDQAVLGPELVRAYDIRAPADCSTCHR